MPALLTPWLLRPGWERNPGVSLEASRAHGHMDDNSFGHSRRHPNWTAAPALGKKMAHGNALIFLMDSNPGIFGRQEKTSAFWVLPRLA